MLPSDEEDRLATQSAGLSTGGGVLGTRSGLPDVTPENNQNQKSLVSTVSNQLYHCTCSKF